MSEDNKTRTRKSSHSSGERNSRKPRQTERYIIAESDKRRKSLLKNASMGFGQVKEERNNVIYTVGNPDVGLIEYVLVNLKLTDL